MTAANTLDTQVFSVHFEVQEFNAKILRLMHSLALNKEVHQQIRIMQTWSLRRNKNFKRRTVCRITGRARASTQRFGLSRMMVRKYGHEGFIAGFTKAS